MDPSKIEAIGYWLRLIAISKVWGFLGLVGYYCIFVLGFSQLLMSMTKFLKEGSENVLGKLKRGWLWHLFWHFTVGRLCAYECFE